MKKLHYLVLPVLAVFLCSLFGCGFAGMNYKTYVQAVLDCTYHDEKQTYIALTQVPEEEAQCIFDEEAAVLSENIRKYYGIKSSKISEDMLENYLQLAEKILKQTKYVVGDVIFSENAYAVTLMLSPLDFWDDADAEVRTYYEHVFLKIYRRTPTKEQADKLEELYANRVLKILTKYAENMCYQTAVQYQFRIGTGEYAVTGEVWQDIDRLLLNLPESETEA